jgi:HK97 family phage prohead protease
MTTATQTQYRNFRPDLEVRASGDGRTIHGLAVPYNAPTRIHDSLIEQFARAAFNHQLGTPNRVKFSREHVPLGGVLIGAATELRDDKSGLYGAWRVSKTRDGDETLELVRDGALSHLSIEFRERQNRRLAGGITERVTADLLAVAVVMEGAYGDNAAVAGVRSAQGGGLLDDEEHELRVKAERFLMGKLPELEDHELKLRALRLGLSV